MEAKLKVPESLEEITLGQYQHFLKSTNGIEGDFLAQKTLEILCNVKLSNVLLIRLQDVREAVSDISKLFEKEEKHVHTFKIKDQEFGFIPNLEKITFGEFVDLDNYLGDWQTMHKAMAVLYRPITAKVKDKYEVYDYTGADEFAEIMKHAPLNVALGAMVFFYHLGSELIKATQNSLLQEMGEAITPKKVNSTLNGDGITASMRSLMEILRDSMELVNSQPLPVLHG